MIATASKQFRMLKVAAWLAMAPLFFGRNSWSAAPITDGPLNAPAVASPLGQSLGPIAVILGPSPLPGPDFSAAPIVTPEPSLPPAVAPVPDASQAGQEGLEKQTASGRSHFDGAASHEASSGGYFSASEAGTAQENPGARFGNFMLWETINDHFDRLPVNSTVAEQYQPRLGREFSVHYIEVPIKDLHVVDHGLGDADSRRHIYREENGERYFRFFIHPESERLYEKMIARYGIKGSYRAAPTSSTRTLLAWDPKSPAHPIFLKLSLDRRQFGLGRAVPDWEVRRSVMVSRLAASISKEDSRKYGVSVIPEIAGAYIDKIYAAGSFIDTKQYAIFEHGMIFRDASFIKEMPEHEIYPLFSLFSMRGAKEPLIVEWWKDRAKAEKIPFEDFVKEAVIEPFVKATGYLVFGQGIIPDAHGQNLVVAVNPKTRRIEHVWHRDVGSMKVDLLLRYAKGLPAASLRSHNADYDFKSRWASEIAGRSILEWFYRYIFTDRARQTRSIKPFVPDYDQDKILRLVQEAMGKSLAEHLPLPGQALTGDSVTVLNVQKLVENYRAAHQPKLALTDAAASLDELSAFVDHQERYGQTLELPEQWFADTKELEKGPVLSDYGVVYRRNGAPRLALLSDNGVAPPFESPTHYEIEVPSEHIVANPAVAQLSIPTPASFPALKIGIQGNPAYHVISHLGALYAALQKQKTIMVKILQDISGLPEAVQKQIIGQAASSEH